MNEIKKKYISAKQGMIWSFIENFSKQLIQFIISLFLVRLLNPSDYGLIGIITVLITFGNTIVDSGFGLALIRKNDCNELDYNTVFYYNLIISLVLYIIFFVSAPFISIYFEQVLLSKLIRVLAVIIVINSLTIIQRVLIVKDVNFKFQTKVFAFSSFLSGIIGVILAWNNYGVWSLVYQNISNSLISTLILWYFNRWKPRFIFSMSSFNNLFTFGSKILLADILNVLYSNLYVIIIGKYFSTSTLGFYSRAESTVVLITNNITNTVKRVSYPLLSKLKDNNEELKSMYKKLVKNTMLICCSFTFGLAAVSDSFIQILFGEKWLPSVHILQLLCFSGVIAPMSIFNLNSINVKGHSGVYLKLQIINKIMIIPIVASGIFMGLNTLLYGLILVSILYFFITSYYSSKYINYSIKEQINDVSPFFFISGTVSLIIYWVGKIDLSLNVIFPLQLILAFLLTFIFYNLIRQKEYIHIQSLAFAKFKNFLV